MADGASIVGAAIQASSHYLDRDRTVAKACGLIREAGREGVDFMVFPEGYVPGHPLWFHFHPATGASSRELSLRLAKNAVSVPGPETDLLRAAAREARANVVVGICERSPTSGGTLYNSQLFIDREGEIVGVHRKLTPTRAERLVHHGGGGSGLIVPRLDFGPASGLICGENTNPLAMFSLLARGTLVHAMSWPDIGGKGRLDRGDRALLAGRAFAFTAKSYVINAVGVLSDEARRLLAFTEEDEAFLAQPQITGGSSIIGPAGEIIAGPVDHEERIVAAELDLDRCAEEKLAHDFAGHYNRSDIFTLHVRMDDEPLYVEHGTPADVLRMLPGEVERRPAVGSSGAAAPSVTPGPKAALHEQDGAAVALEEDHRIR